MSSNPASTATKEPAYSGPGPEPSGGRRALSALVRRRLTLLTMCAASFMISLDVTIVNVGLPAMQQDLRISGSNLEWIISAYALSLAALIPAGGALGDHFGRRRVFLTGLLVFAVGSIACALATDSTVLVAFRAVQGVGGAAMLALTLSILTMTYPAEKRAGAVGMWAAIGGTGFGAGPVAGGVLLTFFGWQSVFWVNVPFAVVTLAGTLVAVPESRNENSRRLDGLGLVLVGAGLVAVTFALVESSQQGWGSAQVLTPLLVGLLLLGAFARWEHRAESPMVPGALLKAQSFVTASVVYLISYATFTGVLFYVTLMYQDVLGWSVLRTGLSWLFMNAPFLVLATLTGRLDRSIPRHLVIAAGCVAAAVGFAALASVSPTTPFWIAAVGYFLSGAGFGLLTPGISHIAMRDVPADVSGAGSGVLNAARQIGTSVGLAGLGAVGMAAASAHWSSATGGSSASSAVAAQSHAVGGGRIGDVVAAVGPSLRHAAVASFTHGYHVAVGVGAAAVLVAAVVALVGLRSGARQPGD